MIVARLEELEWNLYRREEPIARVEFSYVDDTAVVVIGADSYRFRLHYPNPMNFLLEKLTAPAAPAETVYAATQIGFMRINPWSTWSITIGKDWFKLHGGSWFGFSDKFTLSKNERVLGTIEAADWLGTCYRINFPDDESLELQIFLFALIRTRLQDSRRGLFTPGHP